LTLREVAVPAGLSITYLSDLERGVVENPTLDKLRAIAGALGVAIDELVGEPEDETEPLVVYPPALERFAESEAFLSAVRDEAKRLRRDPERLREEWLRVMATIEIAKRRPSDVSDYLFIFEAIRRAVDRQS
jgi:transcriptional regulator with XRE-family HTH domain